MLFIPNRITHSLVCSFFLGLLLLSSCKKDKPLSKLAGFTDFSIKDKTLAFTIDETTRVIQNADSLPYQTNVSALVANFNLVPNSVANVGTTVQVSGTTINNFQSPVTYSVVAQDGTTTRVYTVRVNVALVDPKSVSWELLTADGAWGAYKSMPAGYFNSKFRLYGGTLAGTGTFTAYGVHTSANGVTWTKEAAQAPNTLTIPPAEFTAVVSNFKDKTYLLGGYELGGLSPTGYFFDKVVNNTWSSTDGLNYVKSTAPTDVTLRWIARENISSVVFKDKMWVIGGTRNRSFGSTGSAFNDVWSTTDGENWVSETTAMAVTARQLPDVVVHKDKLYLTGGKSGATYYNEVWTSTDGKTWTQVTTATSFTGRWGHKVISYNNNLYLVGGEALVDGVVTILNDLWVSEDDGVNWTKILAGDVRALPANFNNRKLFSMFVQNNNMYIIGGQGKDANGNIVYRNDVWKGKLVK